MNFQNIHNYYQQENVLRAMLPFIQDRELVWIPAKHDHINKPIRGLNATTTESLSFLAQYIRYPDKKKPYNWYVSLAQYNTPPPRVSLAYRNRIERIKAREQWQHELHRKMKDYTFIIDVDSPSHKPVDMRAAAYSAYQLSMFLTETGHKHMIFFSGMGFHFWIDWKYASYDSKRFDAYQNGNIYDELQAMAIELQDKISELIDADIYDSRRVIKLPYSLAIYEKQVYIVQPIQTLKELTNFKLSNYLFSNNSIEVKNLFKF